MKPHWNRLVGALVVLGIGLAAFAPPGAMHPGVSQSGAAGRTAIGQKAGQLSVAGASAGLSRVNQEADVKPAADGVVVIQPDHMDVSPPLRDIEPIAAPPADPTLIRFRELGLLPGHEKEGSFSGIDSSYQDWHGPAAMPLPIQNWAGINNVGYTVRPPDTQGDVGPDHQIQWVNVRFQIWTKTGTSLYGPALGNTLWSGFGGKCQDYNDGDPVTLYDHLADRWVMMQFALGAVGDGSSDLICIAVSQTGDPTGSWYRYSYTWPNTYFPDYPKIGLWPDGYYLSVNQFNDAGTAWRGAGVAAFQRSAMLTGAAASVQYFNGYSYNSAYGGMLPADWEGATQPPSGAPSLFAEWDDSANIGPSDALRIWNFHVDWTAPANSYFGTAGSPFVPTYTLNTTNVDPTLCAASPACIDQPGTSVMLDDLADRLMHRLQYRNFGSYQTLVSNHTVDTNSPAGRAGIHWFELRNTGSAWAINQQGVYGPADTTSTSRWMGSIAMDGAGNMALGYSITDNVSLYPSIRYVGRLAADTLGTLPQNEATLVTGGGYQNDSNNRWGDYSAMQVDPSDDCTFWYTQEYAQTSGAYNWYTRIGTFKFPSCNVSDFTIAAAPANQTICQGSNATVNVTVGSVGGFSSAVSLSAALSPTGPTASFSPNPVAPPGSSTLTVSGAGAGATNITVTGTAGSLTHQASATLNVSTPLAAAPALTAPANGSTGGATNPTFTWGAVAGATSYDIQVATDPTFANIVALATGLTSTSWTSSALAADTVHYWRVYAVNACGNRVSTLFAFRTAAVSCTTYVSTDVPKAVPPSGTLGTTTSVVNVPSGGGTITDVNITIGQLTHTWDEDLDIHILHPDTTAVELSTDNGSSGDNYVNTVFDDEAATSITAGTAPFTGSFKPEGLLSGLDGKAANGTWTLRVVDDAISDTGTLSSWSLTICGASIASSADYSDLAASYGVAWHTGSGALRLGSGWTADASFVEDGDNVSDDGVALAGNGNWGGGTGAFNVTASGASCLDAWMDFTDGTGVGPAAPGGSDGDFGDSYGGISERVIQNAPLVNGVNNITFSAPTGLLGAGSNTYRFRFRLTARDGSNGCTGISYPLAGAEGGAAGPQATPTAFGAATAGEAEDYKLTFSPLAVTLADFSAVQQGDAVLLTWETNTELNNRGFNLYRGTSDGGPDRQLNETLIPSQSQGNPGGFIYTWDDRTDLVPGTSYFYWVEDVDNSGVATRHGPVSVVYTGPTAVTLSGIQANSCRRPCPAVGRNTAGAAGVTGRRAEQRGDGTCKYSAAATGPRRARHFGGLLLGSVCVS